MEEVKEREIWERGILQKSDPNYQKLYMRYINSIKIHCSVCEKLIPKGGIRRHQRSKNVFLKKRFKRKN